MSSISEKYLEIAEKAPRIVITSHISPDGDSIGSCIGMFHWTKKHLPEKDVHIFYQGEKDLEFNFNELFKNIEWVKDLRTQLRPEDMIVFVDGSELHRFVGKGKEFDLSKYTTFCVDHHDVFDTSFDYYHCEPDSASSTELIVKYFYEDEELTDDLVNEYLLGGIIRDTLAFKTVEKKNSDVLIQTKRIVDNSNIRVEDITKKLYAIDKEAYEVLTIMLSNSKNTSISKSLPPLTYSFVNKKDATKFDAKSVSNAYEDFAAMFIRIIEEHPWGFVVIPEEENYRISFRSSRGGPSAKYIAQEIFGGGGHLMAAGARIPIKNFSDTEDVTQYIIEEILKHEDKLEIISGGA